MIYEAPKDLGIWMRFHSAVRVLSVGTSTLDKKLYRAYYDCGIVHLSSDWFKDEYISTQLKRIEKIVAKGHPTLVLPEDVFVSVNRLYLHWRTATKMAQSIFDIYEYLTKLHIHQQIY